MRDIGNMNLIRPVFLALFTALVIVSCQKDEMPSENQDLSLAGNWINPIYIDTLVTYEWSEKLIENQYGISFMPGNKFTERKNNGWCGTPPVITADYGGTWTKSDSILNINVGYWGGKADYTWKIISLSNRNLVISILKAEYHSGK